jgi:Holliday junction DNA helicase RuvB
VDKAQADKALTRLEVDSLGLDALDHRYLKCIAVNFGGGPVGIETIAASLSEPRDAIEEIIEPYPDPAGFREPHAARAHPDGAPWEHLGLAAPSRTSQENGP